MVLLNLNDTRQVGELEGAAAPEARAHIYHGGRGILSALYRDANLTELVANPLVADGSGRFEICFLTEGTYSVVVTTREGRILAECEDILVRAPFAIDIARGFTSLNDLRADTTLDYSAETRGRYKLLPGSKVHDFRTGVNYAVLPPDAPAPHLQTDGGLKLYVNQNKYELKAEAWGAKFTGSDADAGTNTAALNSAIAFLYSEGQGGRITFASEGHCKTDGALRMLPGVILDGAGSLIENIADDETGEFGRRDSINIGSAHPRDNNDFVYHPCEAVSAGDNAITLTAAGIAATQFAVGDIVQIVDPATGYNPSGGTFGDGAFFVPDTIEFHKIARMSGETLYFEQGIGSSIAAGTGTIGTDAAGAWLANVDWRSAAGRGNGVWTPRHVVRDVEITRFRFATNGGGWWQRGGFYNALIEDIDIGRNKLGLGFNAGTNGCIRNIRGGWYQRAIEVKYGSHQTRLEGFNLFRTAESTYAGGDQETVVSIGEASRQVVVRDGMIDVSGHTPDSGNLVALTGAGASCALRGVTFSGRGTFSTLIGVDGDSEVADCTIDVGECDHFIRHNGYGRVVGNRTAAGQLRQAFLRVQSGSRGGVVRDNVATAAEGPVAIDSGGSGVEIIGNSGISRMNNGVLEANHACANTNTAVARCAARLTGDFQTRQTSATSAELLSRCTLTAASLGGGDVWHTRLMGDAPGSAGTKTLLLRVSVGADSTTVFEAGLPAAMLGWSAEVTLAVVNDGLLRVWGRIDWDSGSEAFADTLPVPSLGANDISLDILGRVNNPTDRLRLRGRTAHLVKPGFATG